MPNWCQITLTAAGSRADLERMQSEVMTPLDDGDFAFDFTKIVPYPEGFDPNLPAGTFDESYAVYYAPQDAERYLSYPWAVEAGVTTMDELRAFFSKRYADAREAYLNAKAEDRLSGVIDESYMDRYPTYKDLADAYKRNRESFGTSNWYDWNVANWGTKWGACDASGGQIADTPAGAEITARFDTAWSFPEPILAALVDRYPTITFGGSFDEEGGFFFGEIENGRPIYEDGTRVGGPYDYGDEDEEEQEAA